VLKTPTVDNLAASVGTNFIDLVGDMNARFPNGLSQVLNGLTVGQTDAFSMDLGLRNGACVDGGNNRHGPVQASATIDTISQALTEAATVAGNVWGTFGFGLRRDQSEHDADDRRRRPSGNEFIGLDNVSVPPAVIGAVPEAETYALLLAGLTASARSPASGRGASARPSKRPPAARDSHRTDLALRLARLRSSSQRGHPRWSSADRCSSHRSAACQRCVRAEAIGTAQW
jgi:hypothetical protein